MSVSEISHGTVPLAGLSSITITREQESRCPSKTRFCLIVECPNATRVEVLQGGFISGTSLRMSIESRISALLAEHEIVIFMKGTRQSPNCGFSATLVEILDEYVDVFHDVDVLADPELRDGIKAFANWPTIPQLFVRGEFVGGSDIVKELAESGELAGVLGRKQKSLEAPDVRLSPRAAAALRGFMEEPGDPIVRVKVSAGFQYALDFDTVRKGDIQIAGEGYTLLVDRPSAKRLDGTVIDFIERPDGGGFKIDNPNEPPKVGAMSVGDLAARIRDNAPFTLFDVRTDEERRIASLPQAIALDDAGRELLEALDRDALVVLACHHGTRSRAAAEHVLRMGFRNVWNLEGGIDAWSREVDTTVPRY